MKLLGTQFFRSLISRIKTTPARQRKRPPQTEVQKSPEALETRIVPATFSELGDQLKVDIDQSLSNVTVSATPTGYKLTLGDYEIPNAPGLQSPADRTWNGTDSANVTGNGTNTLTVTTAGLGLFNSVDVFTSFHTKFFAGISQVTFADSGANSYRSSFNVTINDFYAAGQQTNPNAGQVKFEGTTSFTGGAGLSVFTNANIIVSPGATVSTANGNLALNANQDPTTVFNSFFGQTYTVRDDVVGKDFSGVDIAGVIQSSGTGLISIAGRSIDKAAGDVHGVVIRETASITAGAVGGISIIGTGGAGAGTITGVLNLSQSITTTGPSISIIGTGGDGGANNSTGVTIGASSTISVVGAGSVSVSGTGGRGTGNGHDGVRMLGTITTTTGDVIINGIGGGNPNLVDITAPGDAVQIYGGAVAYTNEGPERAIDNNSAGGAKYANSGKAGTGADHHAQCGAESRRRHPHHDGQR